MADRTKIVVTAALPYANGDIHIGHLLEYIQTDIFVRFLKLQGKDVLYICASDQHGTPIEINAKKAGVKPEKFVEHYWKEHQKDFASFLIEFDNYHKTHSPENRELAEYFFKELKKKELIYTKKIKIIYCKTCKRSLPDRYVKGTCPQCKAEDQYGDICEKCNTVLKAIDLLNPKCSICNSAPIEKDSEHYFFKLSSFSKELKKWINDEKSWIQLEVKNWLNGWLDKGLEDWCISRDAPYFGFEIPGSKEETGETKYFYVWLDAPIGYISSTKNYCDKNNLKWEDYWKKGQIYHIIGKDIAYFHYLFWPAMLSAIGIPLPKLTTHGFITVNAEKMSKSRGTFFTAKDFINLYPAEALRFYYATHLDRKVADIDLNVDTFTAVNNNVLMGNIGNFCYRTLVFAEKNYGQIKNVKDEKKLRKEVETLLKKIETNYQGQEFKSAVKEILKIADIGNQYFQKSEPWKDKEGKQAEVGFCVNVTRILSIIVQPILPELSKKVQEALGDNDLHWKDLSFDWKGKVKKPDMLVEKIEKKEENKIGNNKIGNNKTGNEEKQKKSAKEFPLHIKLGQIKDVKDHPNADSLYLMQVGFGTEKRQVVAGLKKYFKPTELIGKKALFLVNLKPAKLRGEMSEAMTLIAEDKDKNMAFLEVDAKLDVKLGAELGSEVKIDGFTTLTEEITFEQFSKIKLKVKEGKVVFENNVLKIGSEKIVAKGVKDDAKIM